MQKKNHWAQIWTCFGDVHASSPKRNVAVPNPKYVWEAGRVRLSDWRRRSF